VTKKLSNQAKNTSEENLSHVTKDDSGVIFGRAGLMTRLLKFDVCGPRAVGRKAEIDWPPV
jgi:hypothetical protein